ncbi:hypothetical protein EJB05_40388, partial [Eragrostis curvula]
MPLRRPFFLSLKPTRLLSSLAPPSASLRHPRALRPPGPLPPDAEEADDTDAGDGAAVPFKKSRNELKREARRAVQWGMDLAKFPPPQIKRILRAASLESEVFDALMLVKKFGPDVREGKRRQYNYIGSLLRSAQPELMDTLIQASKDGDDSTLQAFLRERTLVEEEDLPEEEESDEEYMKIADRWFEGLLCKDISVTNEVYALHNVEFDRQLPCMDTMLTSIGAHQVTYVRKEVAHETLSFSSVHLRERKGKRKGDGGALATASRRGTEMLTVELRKLVRRVHMVQESTQNIDGSEKSNTKLLKAKKPLLRFLRCLAKEAYNSVSTTDFEECCGAHNAAIVIRPGRTLLNSTWYWTRRAAHSEESGTRDVNRWSENMS